MTARSARDRAALVLGAASALSAAFVVVRGDFQFVRVRGWGVAVAVGLAADRWYRKAGRRTATVRRR